jgi:hypothetical protein
MATMGGAGLFTLMNPYCKPTNAPSENDLSRSFNTRFYNLRFFARSIGRAESFQFATFFPLGTCVVNDQEFMPYGIRDPRLLHTLALPPRHFRWRLATSHPGGILTTAVTGTCGESRPGGQMSHGTSPSNAADCAAARSTGRPWLNLYV